MSHKNADAMSTNCLQHLGNREEMKYKTVNKKYKTTYNLGMQNIIKHGYSLKIHFKPQSN